MENDKTIEASNTLEKLKKLGTKSKGKNTCIAWVSFPYSENNLKIIKKSLKELNWNKEEYRVTYDENFIFVDRELL